MRNRPKLVLQEQETEAGVLRCNPVDRHRALYHSVFFQRLVVDAADHHPKCGISTLPPSYRSTATDRTDALGILSGS